MKNILTTVFIVICAPLISHASLPALSSSIYPCPPETTAPLGRKKTYQYDKLSRATGVKDPAGNISGYAYDALNRPVKAEQTFGGGSYTISYAYDAVGNRTSMTAPWGEYNYTYDALNRLTSIVNPQGINITFAYDAVGRRTRKTVFKALPETLAGTDYTYDKAGQLLSVVNKTGGKVISFARYEYDAAGNRISREDRDGKTTYSYDLANRLILSSGATTAETFVYDDNGNRLSDEGARDYAYDAANRIQANSLYTFTHDLSGNLTSRTARNDGTTTTYAYNPEQKLSEVATPEHRVRYKYDPLGRRIEKSVDGNVQRYVYDNEDIIAVLDGGNGLLRTFTHGPGIDEPLVMTSADGKNYYYHADALGSITALTDDDNTTVETYAYKAYGEPTIKDRTGTILADSAIDNPYLFTARELDNESGLYYYRARYYDWNRGAFTQEEPDGIDGPNLYHYALSNPLRHFDPYGRAATGQIVGAGIGGIVGGYYGGLIGLGSGISVGTIILPGPATVMFGIGGAQTGQIIGASIGAVIGGILGSTIEDVIIYSKGGNQNQRDSGLENLPDSEIRRRARDGALNPLERRRYQKEEKARSLRNVKKRGECQ